jgi:hypothetical protein
MTAVTDQDRSRRSIYNDVQGPAFVKHAIERVRSSILFFPLTAALFLSRCSYPGAGTRNKLRRPAGWRVNKASSGMTNAGVSIITESGDRKHSKHSVNGMK